MNDRAKQILIALVASRLIPRIQQAFGVTLTVADVGDLMVAAVVLWHTGAASVCALLKRYFPNPTQPENPAKVPS